jgi:hypothetical protein
MVGGFPSHEETGHDQGVGGIIEQKRHKADDATNFSHLALRFSLRVTLALVAAALRTAASARSLIFMSL